MIKKSSKMLTVGLVTLFASIASVSAKEVTLSDIDSIIPNPDSESYVFVIGEYLYTNDSYAGITAKDYAKAVRTIVAGENGSLTYYGIVKQNGEWSVDYAFLDGENLSDVFTVNYVDNVELPKDDPYSKLENYVSGLNSNLSDYLDVNGIVESEGILTQANEIYDRAIADGSSEEEALAEAEAYIANEIKNSLRSELATSLDDIYNEGNVAEDGKALDSADYEQYKAVLEEGTEATIEEMTEAYNNAQNARYVLADVVSENKTNIDDYVSSLNKDVLEQSGENYLNAIESTITEVKDTIDGAQNKSEVLAAVEAGKNTIKEALRTKVLGYLEDVYNTSYGDETTVLVMTQGQYESYVNKINEAESVEEIVSLYEEVLNNRTEMSKENYEALNDHIDDVMAKYEAYAKTITEADEATIDEVALKIKSATTVEAVDEAYKAAVKELALATLENYNGGAANYTEKADKYASALTKGQNNINGVEYSEDSYETDVKAKYDKAIASIKAIKDDTTIAKEDVVKDLTAYVANLQGNGALTDYLPEELDEAVNSLEAAIADLQTVADVRSAYDDTVEAIVDEVREKVLAKLEQYEDEKVVTDKVMLSSDYDNVYAKINELTDAEEIVTAYTNATATTDSEDYVLISENAYNVAKAIEVDKAVVAENDGKYNIDVTDEEGNTNKYHNVPEYTAAKEAYEAAIKAIEDSLGTEAEKGLSDVKAALTTFESALESIESDLDCEIKNAVDVDYTNLYKELLANGKKDAEGNVIGTYGEAQKELLTKVFNAQKPKIRAAESIEEISELYDAAVEALMAVQTDEEVFAAAKADALQALDVYYSDLINAEDKTYEINGVLLQTVYEEQKAILEAAVDDEETNITTLFEAATDALDAVEDDATVIAARTAAQTAIEAAITSLSKSHISHSKTSEVSKEIVDDIYTSIQETILEEITSKTSTEELEVYSSKATGYVRDLANPLFKERLTTALNDLYNAGEINDDDMVLPLADYNTAKAIIVDGENKTIIEMIDAYVEAEGKLILFAGDEGSMVETKVSELKAELSELATEVGGENGELKGKTVKDIPEIAEIIATVSSEEFASAVTNETELVNLISSLKASILDKFIEIINDEVSAYIGSGAEYQVKYTDFNTYNEAVNAAKVTYESDENLDTALGSIANAYETMMTSATKNSD